MKNENAKQCGKISQIKCEKFRKEFYESREDFFEEERRTKISWGIKFSHEPIPLLSAQRDIDLKFSVRLMLGTYLFYDKEDNIIAEIRNLNFNLPFYLFVTLISSILR